MLKKSLSILCALSIITVLCLAVGCVKNNPPAITESISSSDTTAQSEDNESTAQSEYYESTSENHETTISSVPDTTRDQKKPPRAKRKAPRSIPITQSSLP